MTVDGYPLNPSSKKETKKREMGRSVDFRAVSTTGETALEGSLLSIGYVLRNPTNLSPVWDERKPKHGLEPTLGKIPRRPFDDHSKWNVAVGKPS